MLTFTVAKSRNAKLGPGVAATYRTPDTCGPCGIASMCYARGRIFAIANRGTSDHAALRSLADTLPIGGALRLNVSGDLFTPDGTLDADHAAAASAVALARPDVSVWTYTHGWRTLPADPIPGAVVNASCETAADLEAATAAGWPTVVVDAGGPDSLIGRTIAGRRVVTCPAAVPGSTRTCSTCRLCARPRRASTVAFPVHGAAGKARGASLLASLR